jgi:hypothetical protein
MLIHNVHSDLLTSITYFLNNFVYTDYHTKIQYFQYNIGNSSFQLDYKTQEELPAAIVTLQSITPYSNKPYVFHRNVFNNVHRMPIIYDRTKNIELFMQEDMYTIAVTININCDSQLQALEMQHRLMNYLPLNKYLQAYKYTSFFELDPNYLSKYLIDVRKDKIENLFYKQNKYTNTFDYCFSVEYEPLIRLNSCDIGIDSSINSSFQIACSFEFLTHLPIYISGPNINWNNPVSFDYLQYNDIPVPIKEDKDYILVELGNPLNSIKHLEIWELNSGKATGSIEYIERTLSASTMINKLKLDALIYIYETVDGEIIHEKCFIDGERINGYLRQIKLLDSSTLTAYFMGMLNGYTINDFLNFEFINIKTQVHVPNLITQPDPPLELLFYKILPRESNVLNSIRNINRSAVKINPSKTYITKYIDINNNLVIFPKPIFINEITHEFILPDNTIGHLDLDTFNLNLEHSNIQYIYLNLSFDYVRGIQGNIEKINYNYNVNNQIIVNASPYKTLSNFNYETIVIISEVIFNEETNEISINIDVTDINNFVFITLDQVILDQQYLKLVSNTSILIFSLLNPSIYWKYFSKVTTLEPIYFCYNLEEI